MEEKLMRLAMRARTASPMVAAPTSMKIWAMS
jgi:hypothetical protein